MRSTCNQAHYSPLQISVSHEDQSSPWSILVLFETWGDTRIGLIELTSDNVYLKTCSARFSQSTGCLIFSLHCELLSGVVSTAAAHDLIFAETDGKCQWQVPVCSWQQIEMKNIRRKVERGETGSFGRDWLKPGLEWYVWHLNVILVLLWSHWSGNVHFSKFTVCFWRKDWRG